MSESMKEPLLDLPDEQSASPEMLDSQVQRAQEQLLQLKRQQEQIEKQKRELEELSGKRTKPKSGWNNSGSRARPSRNTWIRSKGSIRKVGTILIFTRN